MLDDPVTSSDGAHQRLYSGTMKAVYIMQKLIKFKQYFFGLFFKYVVTKSKKLFYCMLFSFFFVIHENSHIFQAFWSGGIIKVMFKGRRRSSD